MHSVIAPRGASYQCLQGESYFHLSRAHNKHSPEVLLGTSKKMIDLILDEDRYKALNDRVTRHEAFGHYSSFWHEFREQASWYSLAGIKRHSWIPFSQLPDYGWHSDKNEFTYYSLDELKEHVEILPAEWNVTELEGETEGHFNINKSKKEDVIIRHFAGGQPWRIEWIKN